MQKTAYEMRISDWSSDVCSSDLGEGGAQRRVRVRLLALDYTSTRRTLTPTPFPQAGEGLQDPGARCAISRHTSAKRTQSSRRLVNSRCSPVSGSTNASRRASSFKIGRAHV